MRLKQTFHCAAVRNTQHSNRHSLDSLSLSLESGEHKSLTFDRIASDKSRSYLEVLPSSRSHSGWLGDVVVGAAVRHLVDDSGSRRFVNCE